MGTTTTRTTQADTHLWRIDEHCIQCGAAQTAFPNLVAEGKDRYFFHRQPESAAETADAWRAALLCPVSAVRAPEGLKMPEGLFPQELGPDLYRLGYNARASWGAHSYLLRRPNGNVMIDGPRWTRQLVEWLEANGGLSDVLLTHKDDVGDSARYAKHFSARVWIHADDRDGALFASDLIEGTEPVTVADDILAVPVPGHTRGSVVFLAGSVLFTGDSLAWSHDDKHLVAFRRVCWYDWPTQLRSLARLTAYPFDRVLPGHGGKVHDTADALHAALVDMLRRYRSPEPKT
ncbi:MULTISPECIES: MBL fold metallo-hydrolase [unclassified Beijerinckia]|uniref:MBL fold metallo-hydrolase n=1 Tax=unclassified Beijerinckia TaxID=2638183 RepID=UPI00089A53A9|nr:MULTISPECIES: MBL fold metallo-hydrolase [unclassified Beijerinckia]MDH7795127.1 glyoxylase-like metal-dependent hydrolase (beta-lactamase superfamily II)/ferredoxin [Beijerinckia sp. GAS462]SEB88602.1 Glyoxylase, beta-lactamase superfamily II [Beijerinckia sp. 28-YEA-48]